MSAGKGATEQGPGGLDWGGGGERKAGNGNEMGMHAALQLCLSSMPSEGGDHPLELAGAKLLLSPIMSWKSIVILK